MRRFGLFMSAVALAGVGVIGQGTGDAGSAPKPTAPAVKCQGRTANVVGTPSADTLPGNPNKPDVINGLAAGDTLGTLGADNSTGAPKKEIICGAMGNDTLNGGLGNDALIGGGGKDEAFGNGGDDAIKGGPGNDTLRGGAGSDTLTGGPGADKMDGGGGGDDTCVIDADDPTPTNCETIIDDGGPPPPDAEYEIIDVDVSASVACGVATTGEVLCWGSNYSGGIGDGTNDNRSKPTLVSGIDNATAIAMGSDHACVVLETGSVKCWGGNYHGPLGNNSETDSNVPVTVSGITTATGIAAGAYHSCAILADTTVQCWGSGTEGQLGNGGTVDELTPVTATGVTGAVQLAAGNYHTCARLTGGTMQCWGENEDGQLGTGDNTPTTTAVAVPGLSDVAAITAGAYFTCAQVAAPSYEAPASGATPPGGAATTAYGARCWGSNYYGQFGNATNDDSNVPVFSATDTGNQIQGLAGGYSYACFLAGTPGYRFSILCSGENNTGQLGNGTEDNSNVLVDTYPLKGGTDVGAGHGTTCAVITNWEAEGGGVKGGVFCWGFGDAGQLGDGNNTSSLTPVRVADLGVPYSEPL